jgi:nifR3 family TIM-barrel protein
MNPWTKQNRPLWVLAPMEEVTDTVFRRVIKHASGTTPPDIFYTEFTSTDGMSHQVGREKVIHRLKYDVSERPIIAQIWGKDPEHYFKVAQDIVELGFDGIDINMGCPVKKIIAQGSCSALIKSPEKASEIIKAVQAGTQGNIPVSVKTRIGFDSIVTEEWCAHLLSHNLDALIIHGRTTREQSKVPNHWEEISKVPLLRDKISPKTLIIGNGDITSRELGEQKISETGIDGVMIGRGILQNPWFFNKDYKLSENGIILHNGVEITSKERLDLLQFHLNLWSKTYSDTNQSHYNSLKRFFKVYINGFNGASELRNQLMQTTNINEVNILISNKIPSI